MASKNRVGVYFSFMDNQQGVYQKEQLNEYKNDIKSELGQHVNWEWDKGKMDGFSVRLDIDDVYAEKNKNEIVEFFNKWSNIFVNTMRPKLKNIE